MLEAEDFAWMLYLTCTYKKKIKNSVKKSVDDIFKSAA